MMMQIAAKLMPYFSIFLMGQIILFCLAILCGAFLLLKVFTKKQAFEGDLSFDHQKIAAELQEEIMRLKELKRRLVPGAPEDNEVENVKVDPSVAQVPAATPTTPSAPVMASPEAPAPSSHAAPPPESNAPSKPSPEMIAEIEGKVAEIYKARIAELQNKISGLEQNLAKAASAPPPSTESAAPDVLQELNELKVNLEKEKTELVVKVEVLEKTISEYQLFEEDFARVKQYKIENDRLKKQLTDTHRVTEADIDKLFNSFDISGDPTKKAEPSNDADFFSSAAMESDQSSTPTLGSSEPAVTTPPLSSAPSADIVTPAPTPGEDYDVEKLKADPAIQAEAKEQNIEDLAESAVNDDELLEQFQKILGDQTS